MTLYVTAVATLAGMTSVAPAAIASVARPSPVRPSACTVPADPYSQPKAILAACGDSVFPRLTAKPLPGGGTSYLYRVDGNEVIFNVPPRGFNPLTASARTLREYNLPSRAMLGERRWVHLMRHLRLIAPPPFLVTLNHRIGQPPGIAPDVNSSNWAGNYANGHSNYGYVHATWNEPTIATSCSSSDVAQWVGLGGITRTDQLAQDGTAYGVPGLGNHQAWWEILPANPTPVNVTATAGQGFDAYTSRETHNGQAGYVFFLENDYTRIGVSPFIVSSRYSGDSGDVITERTENLRHFNTFNIVEADAAWGGNDFLFGNSLPHVGVWMYGSSGRQLASPGSINSSGGWSMTYHNCN